MVQQRPRTFQLIEIASEQISQFVAAMALTFLIVAQSYTHRSSGIRALYRLCHHLNNAGYPTAMTNFPGQEIRELPDWDVFAYNGPMGDAIVIYPEVVLGNPYGAAKVVRWALNTPGLLAGDKTYPPEEMVFVYDVQRLAVVSEAAGVPLDQNRILWLGLIDPRYIFPGSSTHRNIHCLFTHKGHQLFSRYPLPDGARVIRLEDITPTMSSLGHALRSTRIFYSYDHYSNVLREAVICGCDVLVIGDDGSWHDPRTCHCSSNIRWVPGFEDNYAAQFHDGTFVKYFIEEIQTRWAVAASSPEWKARLPKVRGCIYQHDEATLFHAEIA